MKITLRFLLIGGLAVACAWAQRIGTSGGTGGTSTGGTTGGTGTSGTGTTSSSGSTTPSTQPSTTTQQPPESIFLSGGVATDDGSPLPGSVDIQAVCGTTQRIVAHTGADGSFAFRWSFTTGAMFEDASENGRVPGISTGSSSGSSRGSGAGGGLPGDPLAGCDLRAEISGYTSSRVSLYNHQGFDNGDVGTITLHRLTGDEGRTVSALSLKAPRDAKKNFDKGEEQVRGHKTAEAAASFQKAVTIYPQYADAWLELGRANVQLGSKDEARTDFQKAMDLDDKLVGPWQQLGYLASDQSDWISASHYLDQAVRLDPIDSAMAWYFDAMANYDLGRFDAAERSLRAEMKLDTSPNPKVDYLLGLVLIARKDVAGGAAVLRKFVKTYPDVAEAPSAKKILASAETALAAEPHQ